MENKIYIHRKYENMPPSKMVDSVPIESKRRTLLKYALFGSGFFMLGKIFGPSLSMFSSDTDLSKITNFENFRIVESGKGLEFFDKLGNEILTLDKDA
jgi:hypothetical protein